MHITKALKKVKLKIKTSKNKNYIFSQKQDKNIGIKFRDFKSCM